MCRKQLAEVEFQFFCSFTLSLFSWGNQRKEPPGSEGDISERRGSRKGGAPRFVYKFYPSPLLTLEACSCAGHI